MSSSGARVQGVELPNAFDVVRDPSLDFLYVGVDERESASIVIEVFRTITLEHVATMRGPAGPDFNHDGGVTTVLAMGQRERAIYVVDTARPATVGDVSGPASSVLHFNLPEAQPNSVK